jgi:hypothetical protein
MLLSLGQLVKRAPSPVIRTLAEKTEALKLMSLDMSSAGVIGKRPIGGGPVIAKSK